MTSWNLALHLENTKLSSHLNNISVQLSYSKCWNSYNIWFTVPTVAWKFVFYLEIWMLVFGHYSIPNYQDRWFLKSDYESGYCPNVPFLLTPWSWSSHDNSWWFFSWCLGNDNDKRILILITTDKHNHGTIVFYRLQSKFYHSNSVCLFNTWVSPSFRRVRCGSWPERSPRWGWWRGPSRIQASRWPKNGYNSSQCSWSESGSRSTGSTCFIALRQNAAQHNIYVGNLM